MNEKIEKIKNLIIDQIEGIEKYIEDSDINKLGMILGLKIALQWIEYAEIRKKE